MLVAATVVAVGTTSLTACAGARRTAGMATPAPVSTTETPDSGAPQVSDPLSADALDGSPCETALTSDQVSTFLGDATRGRESDSQLGPICNWSSNTGSGAGIAISYQTKSDQGIGLAYRNVQPVAARWQPLEPIQGFPAVAYANSDDIRACVIVVGVTDELAFSIGLTLGDKATSEGKDSFDLGRQVADVVALNLKAKA
ncbi:DUF3558 domain-containing protein [Amycolatopsis sp. NBC_00438]|uniref:DUF3558 domain-containing protein n=1 Tax=Amycolatopsis sp. NBC_00438 TaxID=2903558 RepID=UPI002E1E614A